MQRLEVYIVLSNSPVYPVENQNFCDLQDSTLRYASILPEGTLGHAYHLFMNKRHFSADERPSVRFVDDPELAYVATRYREVHDLWHVLFGCHTSVLGELALKVVEFVQVRYPFGHCAGRRVDRNFKCKGPLPRQTCAGHPLYM